MISNCLLIFDDFDPVSNYKLELIKRALDIEKSIDTVIFAYFNYKQGDRVFHKEEKLALLSASIPSTPIPKYLIDGDSFCNESYSIGHQLRNVVVKHKNSTFFFLLDSEEFLILEQYPKDWSYICSMVQLIIYILPEHKDLIHDYSFTSKNLLFINSDKRLDSLKRSSILEVSQENYSSVVIEYMNKSGECGIKRIKAHLSESRFKHSIRVAGTVKRICELLELEDLEIRYDSYLAALYHDICKELPLNIQKEIAVNKLGLNSDLHLNSFHGPAASWYLKNKYLFKEQDILEAIFQHTNPPENPKDITIYLYLADKLEVSKKARYPEEIYNRVWDLIEKKQPHQAFNLLINFLKG